MEINDIRFRFRRFTKIFLNPELRCRWNELFDKGVNAWGNIEPWDLWIGGNSFNSKEWTENCQKVVPYLESVYIEKVFVIGLGHSEPFYRELNLSLLSNFFSNRCVIDTNYWLEGLILTDNENLSFASNHDGNMLLFSR